MAEELAYVLVNPYTLFKSRTGGVLSRLLSRTALDLVAARMFAPSKELVEKYAEASVTDGDPQPKQIQELIRQYILDNYMPDAKTGHRRRVMMWVFRGENAVQKVRNVVGNVTGTSSSSRIQGETIRDTYGDYVVGPNGEVRYFEPAVLAAPNSSEAETKLKLWTSYSDTDSGLLEGTIAYPANVKPQRALVLIKPDNFLYPSGRPGSVVDVFSRTGLYIVGMKVHRMSVAQGEEFYGPVKEVLRTKLKDVAVSKVLPGIEQALETKLSPEAVTALGDVIGPVFGEAQFENIVQFMTGSKPSACDDKKKKEPGSAKVVALVYEGPDAIRKIRDVLGPTDPKKAGPGTIRREFGQSVMVNAAHASDSPENAAREIGIINVAENDLKQLVQSFYSKA